MTPTDGGIDSEAQSDAVGRPLGRRYLIFETIGAGAMGQVFRATDRENGDDLAAKVLRPELSADEAVVRRFVNERILLMRLHSPHIVKVLDMVVEGDTLAIVMPRIKGGSLRDRIVAAGGGLATDEAVGFCIQIFDALATAHATGVIHRDVKPENILIDRTGPQPVAMVTDFGISGMVSDTTHTRLTSLVGTVRYMAPELLKGGVGATSAVDIYGAGVMLYELLCGHPPFTGGEPMAVLYQHAHEDPPRPDGIPDALWGVLEDLLAKEPADRPSASVAASMLRGLGFEAEEDPLKTRMLQRPVNPMKEPPVTPKSGAPPELVPPATYEATEIHDFEDDEGPVPSHQHPNGRGWVADTAKVSPTAFVGPDASVFGVAQVLDHATVTGTAWICGEAEVCGHCRIGGDAVVDGNSKVMDNAEVDDDAYVGGHVVVAERAKVGGNARLGDRRIVRGQEQIHGDNVVDGAQLGTRDGGPDTFETYNDPGTRSAEGDSEPGAPSDENAEPFGEPDDPTYRRRVSPLILVVGALLLLIAGGGAAFLFARNDGSSTIQSRSSSGPPTTYQQWFAALGIDVCGTMQPNLPSSINMIETGLIANGNGVVTIQPKNSSESGGNATLGKFVSGYKGLELSSSTLKYPGKHALNSGDICPTGTPDAGKPGVVIVDSWPSFTSIHGTETSGTPEDLLLENGQLITMAFVPATVSVPKPPADAITALISAVNAGATASVTGPSTTLAP